MAPPRVDVLVLTYNAGPALEECLRSLQSTTYPSARLVVLDNGSVDGSLATAKELHVETVAFGSNLGYCSAYNRAFREVSAGADFVLLSNPDLVVPPPAIERLVAAALVDDTIGFAGPLQLHSGSRAIRSAGIRWRCGRLPEHVVRPGEPIDAVEGAFVLVRHAVIEKVGGLEEALALNLEDVEWQMRARKAGFRSILVPEVSILHHPPGRGRVVRGAYYQARNALFVTQRLCDESASRHLERRLRWEGRLGRILGRPRGPEILRGIADFHAGRMGMRSAGSAGL